MRGLPDEPDFFADDGEKAASYHAWSACSAVGLRGAMLCLTGADSWSKEMSVQC